MDSWVDGHSIRRSSYDRPFHLPDGGGRRPGRWLRGWPGWQTSAGIRRRPIYPQSDGRLDPRQPCYSPVSLCTALYYSKLEWKEKWKKEVIDFLLK